MKNPCKDWNARHKELRSALQDPTRFGEGIELFLRQHGEVHAGEMSHEVSFSFEDEALRDLAEEHMRVVPEGMEHSIAWVLWHLARIEDVTMNVLAAGEEQLFTGGGWVERLGAPVVHTGNAMTAEEVVALSHEVDIGKLRKYRIAVGRATERVVRQLTPEELHQPTSQERLERLLGVGAVTEDSYGLIEYWGNRTIAGLLLMPPTRHCFVHLNEAARIKKKVL